MPERRQIFREQSLRKVSSPDRLDELLGIIGPRSWILVSATGVGFLLALVWSVLGRVPVTATGSAILVRPKQVVAFQSPASGSIRSIDVAVGSDVERGDVLATLRLPTLEKALEQECAKLEQFTTRTGELSALERELAAEELGLFETQRRLLEGRSANLRAAAERYRTATERYIEEQRSNIDDAKALAERLGEELASLLHSYRMLEGEGNATKARVTEAFADSIANQRTVAELEVKRKELDLTRNQAQEYYDSQTDLVEDLAVQLNQLKLRAMAIERRLREDELESDGGRQEIERRIEALRVQLDTEGRIVAEHDGRVLEITVAIGQHLAIGERVGKLEIVDPDAVLEALAYLRVEDGKKIKPGLKIRVSPGTVERERFGAILGTVLSVSGYPVSVDAAASQIGDRELARDLLAGQSRIEVAARLELDRASPTGYLWTSGAGPDDVPITAGTTAQVRVTLEERAPITFVLPFLDPMLAR